MIQKIVLVRHGQTKWAKEGRHTGVTNLPLTEEGVLQAKSLRARLEKEGPFDQVLTSPLERAQQTAKLAGFSAAVEPGLIEWNYGKYEGKTTEEIRKENPAWNLFHDGAPGGEGLQEVENRARLVLEKLSGLVLLFSSAHILRAFAACFLGLPVSYGQYGLLSPASVSILGYEHTAPVIILWNDISHLRYT